MSHLVDEDDAISHTEEEEGSEVLHVQSTSRRSRIIDRVKNSSRRERLIAGAVILLFAIAVVLFVLVLSYFVIRDRSLKSKQAFNEDKDIVPVEITASDATLLSRFKMAIDIPTFSGNDQAFQRFHNFIEENYPLIHATLTLETFANYTLLYTWNGQNLNCKPILLLNHIDVVPAGNESLWRFPPFNATVSDGHLYGRGTLDTKSTVVSVLEALNALLEKGYRPERTVFFLFTHDEETGSSGASAVASAFKQRGVKLDWMIDEGTPINMIPPTTLGISHGRAPDGIAFVGLSDKGVMKVKLSVDGGGGGHASAPPIGNTAIGILASAIVSIESKHRESSFVEPVTTMLNYLTPEMDKLADRIRYNNLELFGGYMLGKWSSVKYLNPHIRSTVATTIVNGGVAMNILPQSAEAILDIRLRPVVDTCEQIMQHLSIVVDNPKVKIEMLNCAEKKKIARVNNEAFTVIRKSIRSVYKKILVSPGLFIAGTDSVYFKYMDVVDDAYLFSPYIQIDNVWLHAVDENISINVYKNMIQFYAQLVTQGAKCNRQ